MMRAISAVYIAPASPANILKRTWTRRGQPMRFQILVPAFGQIARLKAQATFAACREVQANISEFAAATHSGKLQVHCGLALFEETTQRFSQQIGQHVLSKNEISSIPRRDRA